LRDAREQEAQLEAAAVDVPADPNGRWSAKDQLAHLAWWRNRAATVVDAARTGGEQPAPVEDDARNALTYLENKDRSAADVKADARASWDGLARAVEACSEEDLVKPHPVQSDMPLWDSVSGSYAHLGNHLTFWYMDSNNEEAAESAQLWAWEIDSSLFATPQAKAYADYNLACFYARVGRPDKAVPLLLESFKGVPTLLDNARTDPDLERIRDDPRLKKLLGA
jgi:hypothetical protein